MLNIILNQNTPCRPRPRSQVSKLKKLVEEADEVVLATDEDREGEAIAWHLLSDVKNQEACLAHCFSRNHQIRYRGGHCASPSAGPKLSGRPTGRRILDRLDRLQAPPCSPPGPKSAGLSAGRVQSVAVRMIVERERERLAFKNEEYWTVEGLAGKGKTRVCK